MSVFDRTPPHDADAERALLGAMLLSKDAIEDVADDVRGEHFYIPKHETIFDAALELYAAGEACDAVTLSALLDKRGALAKIGGPAYLHDLMEAVPSAASAGYYAEIVADKALLRSIGNAGMRGLQMATSTEREDADEILNRFQAEVFALGRPKGAAIEPSNAPAFEQMLSELDDEDEESIPTPGLRTGFRDLDELTDGLPPAAMTVIAARSSMGKSTLAADFHRQVSIVDGHHSLYFSLEMKKNVLLKRILSAEASIPLRHLMRRGGMTDADWKRVAHHYADVVNAPLHIDDRRGLTLTEIWTTARRLARRHPLKLITVDYMQLIKLGGRGRINREQEVAEVSHGLCEMADDLNVSVVAVAQLNRGSEARGDKRPSPSDLRESDAPFHDCDLMILPFREDYYEKESPRAGEADLIIPKFRNGPTCTLTVAAQMHFSRFIDFNRMGAR